MKDSFKTGQEVVKEIMQYAVTPFLENNYDLHQLETMMLPHISNAMFFRDAAVLQKERMETLITLARTLDNETIEKVVDALKYEITLKK
jgi:hypothetical protein